MLVHGITSTSATWANVLPYLAERFTVIAPDLLGHGESAKPRGDYSLGAYASGIRDLLLALGHDRATFVGHSLGGGVAMQLAYQFPEHCERLALVSSGGLGREINALLRAASLPGSELVLPFLVDDRIVGAGRVVGSLLGRIGLRVHTDVGEVLRGHASLSDGQARAAFLHTLRPIVDIRGQRVDATDRLYLAESIPFLIMWGVARPDHPRRSRAGRARSVVGSRLEVFPGAGHFPHLDDPLRFVRVLGDFIDTTEPSRVDPVRWGELLRDGARRGSARRTSWSGPTSRGDTRALALIEELGRMKGAGAKLVQFLSMLAAEARALPRCPRRAASRRGGGPVRARAPRRRARARRARRGAVLRLRRGAVRARLARPGPSRANATTARRSRSRSNAPGWPRRSRATCATWGSSAR